MRGVLKQSRIDLVSSTNGIAGRIGRIEYKVTALSDHMVLLSVHTRSELSDQIAGSHSLSMGKSDQSDQSDQRYQRPKLSDQSVKKKLKTF